EKQQRLAIFTPLEGKFPILNQSSLKEALDIFDAGQESDDSTSKTATCSASAPLLRIEDTEAGASPVHAQGLPVLATTPLPAMDTPVSALPDIIGKIANAKGVSVPALLVQASPDDLAGKFATAHPARRDPVWPRFPAVTAYLSGAAAELLQLKALVSTFAPIARVESLTDQGLEPSLSVVFEVRAPPPPAIRSQPH
ncbi:hypothetical protein GOODEAATRI_010354, partial [Goodea atripinnis]